ncbi:MAG: hypothetical protein EOM37_02725 [Proteobacteria bacterium]|jgi:hypothetical protein|nr:hypothetical protein [Alphaproteobacteria bacterium]NCC02951.1 hypothetical protein [Pseudomonadota bacterium]
MSNEMKEPKIVTSFKVTSADGAVYPCHNVGMWANSNTYDGMTRSNQKTADAPSEAPCNGRRSQSFAQAKATYNIGYGLN